MYEFLIGILLLHVFKKGPKTQANYYMQTYSYVSLTSTLVKTLHGNYDEGQNNVFNK